MKIIEEKYKIVGVIKKVCICEKCNAVMQQTDTILPSYPMKQEVVCPKCGSKEYVDAEILSEKIEVKKVDK